MEERAYAALLGWFTGDGFGSQSEGREEQELSLLAPDGLTEVYTLESIYELCGMSSEASDLSVLLALSMLDNKALLADHVKASYRRYVKCEDAELSPELVTNLEHEASTSESALILSRSLVMGLALIGKPAKRQRQLSHLESALFTTSPLAQDAAYLMSLAFSLTISEKAEDAATLVGLLLQQCSKLALDERLGQMLKRCLGRTEVKHYEGKQQKMALSLLETVFSTLLVSDCYESGVRLLASRGGNARLSCALYGGLAASLEGSDAVPERWIDELFVSPALDSMIKKQTLFKRETIRMEKLARTLATSLLELEI